MTLLRAALDAKSDSTDEISDAEPSPAEAHLTGAVETEAMHGEAGGDGDDDGGGEAGGDGGSPGNPLPNSPP